MRLIGAAGEQVGIVPIAQALKMAEEAEVDLVEIAPLAKPPVCKLMDYGKFKYREAKKAHEAKLKQKQIHVKEVKFRPGTDEGDYKIKLRNLIKFLDEGDSSGIGPGLTGFPAPVGLSAAHLSPDPPIRGERIGVQVRQIVGLRRAPE